MSARFEVTARPITENADGLTASEGPPCAEAEGDDLPALMQEAGEAAAAWMDDADKRPIAFRAHVVVTEAGDAR